MMYGSWDTEWNGLNFFPLWAIFCPFIPPLSPPTRSPLTTRKIKILKKWENDLELASFYACLLKITIIWCILLRHGVRQVFFVIFSHFLHFYPPNNLENQNFEKMRKAPTVVVILHMSTKNQDHMMYASWDMECNRQIFYHF